MNNNTTINWDEIPDIITKEQFYRICHISKTTALNLLRSGKVPCEYSDKKTRCYRIRKEDVKNYLEQRAIYPEAYSAPRGWYCGGNKKSPKEVPPIIIEDMHDYYADKLINYSDVMTTQDVCNFTGYCKTAVNRWCAKEQLKSFRKGNRYLIPKVFLVDFLCSIDFRAIQMALQCPFFVT